MNEEIFKAKIIKDVAVTGTDGNLRTFLVGKNGRIDSREAIGPHGNPCFRWLEPWWDGMGGSGNDVYFVPTEAVVLDNPKIEPNEYTRFPNLAGLDTSDAVCTHELETAGIEVVKLPEICRYGEPDTIVMGSLGPWSFKRAWYYWVAEGPGIPLDIAEKLHEQHGKVVRVDGHCGAPSPLEWFKGFAVGHYHVDAQEGLLALAETIKAVRKG